MKSWLLRTVMIVSVITFGLGMSGCSSDDGVDSNLFGTWTLDRFVLRECNDASLEETEEQECTAARCTRLVINEDGTYTQITTFGGQDSESSGTWEVRGVQIRLEDSNNNSEVLEFTVTATQLTMTRDQLICLQDIIYTK